MREGTATGPTKRLLEREPELASLDAALAAAQSSGRIAVVRGEAGIGKSALVQAFLALHPGPGPRLIGRCEDLSTPEPFGPLRDVAEPLSGQVRAALRDRVPRLDLFEVVLSALRSSAHPPVLVLEDLHWADAGTLDLIRFLGRRIAKLQALLVLTYRDDELDRKHPLWALLGNLPPQMTLRLALSPLSKASVSALAGSGSNAGRIHQLSRGNPFFVTELIAEPDAHMPLTVSEAVLARASRLTDAGRGVLDFCAILPGRVPLALVEAAIGPSLAELEACADTGLLILDDGACRFRHELARQAIEEALPTTTAALFHSRVLEAAGQGGAPEIPLAQRLHHAAKAGAGDTVLALAPGAASDAAAAGAHREAAAHLGLALREAWRLDPVERTELIERHAYECYLTGEIETAVEERLLALAERRTGGHAAKVSDNLRWLSRLYWFLCRQPEAMVCAEDAISALDASSPCLELGWARSNRAQLLMLESRSEEAIAEARRALLLADQLGLEELRVHALNNLGTARLQSEDAQGWRDLEEGLHAAIAQDMHEHACRAYTNLSYCAVVARDYPRAEDYFAAGIGYALERDLDSWTDYMQGVLARLQFEKGRWTEAAELAARVLGSCRVPITRLAPLVVLGLIRLRRGDPGGVELLSEAEEIAKATKSIMRIGPVSAALAEAAWLDGDFDGVRSIAEPALRLARNRADRAQVANLAFWLRLAEEEVSFVPPAWPARLSGACHPAEMALAWRDLGCPYEVALVLQSTNTAGQIEALALLDGLGAARAAAVLRRRMRDAGVRKVPRGRRMATRNNQFGLTARQAEVLALMADGLGNREIADRLVISVRTVDHHVSAVLAKLEAQDRHSAVLTAAKAGAAT